MRIQYGFTVMYLYTLIIVTCQYRLCIHVLTTLYCNPFPTLITSEVIRICETVPTPARATADQCADRLRALGYMIW